MNKVAARCEAVVAAAVTPDARRLLAPAATRTGITCTVEPYEPSVEPVWSPGLAGLLFAIHSLARDLERSLRSPEAPRFDPPYSTVNNGLVCMDQARLSYVLDVRRVPGESARCDARCS